ncbi:bifunctional riboflavin kinase/FAD synthetase [Legionella erythra]|uniref:Riboflavin biosynthesis protein n=1 Tax=Legionella erythra TaxID=448 RepID=A0A0W0TJN3_LEGER|nr:bifunctional riboflavin kinase/FAD synthetase [Legionella erythra]KTC95770.1 riboflavin biosynthesis protein RibF (riboflavin kinase/FMN adenylyltransferase) [Legionella erythra]
MRLLRGISFYQPFIQGSVVTIGNFDGVHLGHQALLTQLRRQAQRLNLPSVVILFEPQPGEYLHPQTAPARLSTLREKLARVKELGIDYVYCLRFNQSLATLTAEDFARTYFFTQLSMRYLLVGEDFRFGYKRQGDIHLLRQMAEEQDCTVETIQDFTAEGARVSSTRIRHLLAKADLHGASRLLGRTYSLCGRVSRGEGRGRQWGIPTANLSGRRANLPLQGVFCVRVQRQNGQLLEGVANLGRRPTVDGSKVVLEVHLFNFNGNLYGEFLQVFFLHKLRDEKKFSSIGELIAQIQNDIDAAKAAFRLSAFKLT